MRARAYCRTCPNLSFSRVERDITIEVACDLDGVMLSKSRDKFNIHSCYRGLSKKLDQFFKSSEGFAIELNYDLPGSLGEIKLHVLLAR